MSKKEISEFMRGEKQLEKSFEIQWLAKFRKCLTEAVGEDTTRKVMMGSERVEASASQIETINWTKEAIDKLDALVDEKNRKRIMTGCACHFPENRLLPLRAKYSETKDIDSVHGMLREMFISDLKNELKLDDDLIGKIVISGWGVAGLKIGSTIILTKLPFELREYLKATDSREKRRHYCHCPRIREAIKLPEHGISTTYCYCGAGFYKDIWEKILQQTVEVEVLETVLQGSGVCRIAIHLPNTARTNSRGKNE